MRNLITGLVHEETFRSEEKLPTPDLEYKNMKYLYEDNDLFNFLDEESFEQVAFEAEQISEVSKLLQDQAVYTVLYFSGRPIAVTPPLFMELKVVETVPGVRGDTAQGAATKPATLETGLIIQVPLFVNEGDVIKLDTRDERAHSTRPEKVIPQVLTQGTCLWLSYQKTLRTMIIIWMKLKIIPLSYHPINYHKEIRDH